MSRDSNLNEYLNKFFEKESSIYSEITELTANPINREKMALLWLEQGQLEGLSGALSLGLDTILIDDFVKGGTRNITISDKNLEWAKTVRKVAAKAEIAARQRDFKSAIQYYKEALKIAPGADIFIMSIGNCYGNMGLFEKGIAFLRCALTISPASTRIINNLQKLEASMRQILVEKEDVS